MPGTASIVISLFEGFKINLEIFVLTLVFAIPLGLLMSLGSMSKLKIIKFPMKVFIWIIRGTPLMLQLFVALYAPGLLFGVNLPDLQIFGITISKRLLSCLFAFIINYAAYFSEIFRGGIESISKGQREAGQVLGLTRTQIFFKIILLQVVKRIVPPMSNEIITLVKDTSLARVIGVMELIMAAERYTKMGLIAPLFSTGLFFLAFNGILTLLFGWIERKLDYIKA